MEVQITEYLNIDLEREMWLCRRCGKELISARDNYKKGCLVYDRDPNDIHDRIFGSSYTFSPDPEWVRYLEFYCPGCGTLIDVQPLPPGHPITHDILIDIDNVRKRVKEGNGKKRQKGAVDESNN